MFASLEGKLQIIEVHRFEKYGGMNDLFKDYKGV